MENEIEEIDKTIEENLKKRQEENVALEKILKYLEKQEEKIMKEIKSNDE